MVPAAWERRSPDRRPSLPLFVAPAFCCRLHSATFTIFNTSIKYGVLARTGLAPEALSHHDHHQITSEIFPVIFSSNRPQFDRLSCYKSAMGKISERWLLFRYVGLEMIPLSKPFITKGQAEEARLKYPERERKGIGIGVIRTKT